ncbi:MAG: hypothetical protein IKP86_04125 [Anaerolineaceae bacterium]|nr:hypothetical protein [Anaerolineaceae bacterium]
MENSNGSVKLVAGICPKCGGQLEVDPSQDAAICAYCGTPFVVSKAINNYNVQNAQIEHVDHVHVDLKGSVDSIIGLAEREIDKNREDKKEERRLEQENTREMFKNFWKGFIILCVIVLVFWIIASKLGVFN